MRGLLATARSGAWTVYALARVRRRLRRDGIAARAAAVPGWASVGSVRGVTGVLGSLRATCLERSLVLQAWHAARGVDRDVIIGVTAPAGGFAAHAWLEGEPEGDDGFQEIHRLSRCTTRST